MTCSYCGQPMPVDRGEGPVTEEACHAMGAHVGNTCTSFSRDYGRGKTASYFIHRDGCVSLYLTDEDDKQIWYPMPKLESMRQLRETLTALGIQSETNQKEKGG